MRMFYRWREVEKTYHMSGEKKELKCLEQRKKEKTDDDIRSQWIAAFQQAQNASRGE